MLIKMKQTEDNRGGLLCVSKIEMTTNSDEIKFSLKGTGVATVDFGDGSEKISCSIDEDCVENYRQFSHKYPNKTLRKIAVYGDRISGLDCIGNQLTNLDVSNNSVLRELYCSESQLTSLDVSKNSELYALNCSKNQLTNLDVSQNSNLLVLDCSKNQLTNLDVSQNSGLLMLSCCENQLTSLDVSKNIGLTALLCTKNQLTNLDVSNNTALKKLCSYDNPLCATV